MCSCSLVSVWIGFHFCRVEKTQESWRKILIFRHSCMCWLLTYFLVLIKNELRVKFWLAKHIPMFIRRAPVAIFAGPFKKKLFSLNIVILHRLRNKFLQLILISLDSTSWELYQYSRRMSGPMKIPTLTSAPRHQTRDLMIPRPILYLTTTDTTQHTVYKHCYR